MSVLFPDVADALNVRLFSAGHVELGEWWPQTDLLRDFWRLYRVDVPGVALDLGVSTFRLLPGRLVLVPPALAFRPVVSRRAAQLFTHFEFVGWAAEAAREIFPAPVTLERDDLRDRLAGRLKRALTSARSLDAILASRLKSLVHLAIAAALEEIPRERADRFVRIARGQQELLAVLHYIDEHLDQTLSNARLAEIAVVSESRFIRRFREATGRTPGRYVQERRVRRAAELLVSTHHSVDRIAELCGFTNRFYFTRVFGKRMGCPPARYRSDRPFLPASDPGAGLGGSRS